MEQRQAWRLLLCVVAITAVFAGEKWWRARSGAIAAWREVVQRMDGLGRAVHDADLASVAAQEPALRSAASRLDYHAWVMGPRKRDVRRLIAALQQASRRLHRAAAASNGVEVEAAYRSAVAVLDELRGRLPSTFGSAPPADRGGAPPG
jgi:hypothetical protein